MCRIQPRAMAHKQTLEVKRCLYSPKNVQTNVKAIAHTGRQQKLWFAVPKLAVHPAAAAAHGAHSARAKTPYRRAGAQQCKKARPESLHCRVALQQALYTTPAKTSAGAANGSAGAANGSKLDRRATIQRTPPSCGFMAQTSPGMTMYHPSR